LGCTTYKGEKINIAEYLNTKYKEDQFVNIVKSYKSLPANMNSTIKIAAKVIEELNQKKERSDTKKGIHHTKARLGEFLKKKWESKVIHGQYNGSINRQLSIITPTSLCTR
jgi:tripartite-type tricarboxylate transporter receptor subunit TctC